MTKTCTSCGQTKQLDEFEFIEKKNCWRNVCKMCRSDYLRNWRQKNKSKTLEYSRIKHEKLKDDPNYKIARLCRTRIWDSLKAYKNKKTHKTLDLVGLDVDSLRKYLESLFEPGMSWDNHGTKWHIDHIRPCASFDLSQPEELKACFHFTNLQPLWAFDNLSKGSRWSCSEGHDHRSTKQPQSPK